jgi:hypothetical protein
MRDFKRIILSTILLLSTVLPCLSVCNVADAGTQVSFPDYWHLAHGPWQVRLLPGQHEFVFTSYGMPGQIKPLKQLVQVMRAEKLGNGFDPGPTPHKATKPLFDYLAGIRWPVMCYPGCADMQIKDGRCILTQDDEAALAEMDKAGVFNAIQLGEWGYYFHNLASDEHWWREVYGSEFETYKHLMKPAGLAGYDRLPANRQECYAAVKDYFVSRNRDLLDRTISVTGHSHYEAYAAEWGARCIGLEVGENIAFTQSKLAFARGASRQWQKPWSVQVSPWFAGACTTSGPLRWENGFARGLDAGHSLNFYERMWLHAWFAGAAMVTPENSLAIFFEHPSAPWTLTQHGRKASEVFRFMRKHDRGVAFTPVAIVLDHLAGYNGYKDKPWGILEPTAEDRKIRDLFDFQLFPGSDHIHGKPDARNPEASYLRSTPYGECFDVLLTGATPDTLSAYPVLLLAGDIEFQPAFVTGLKMALRRGAWVLIGEHHRNALGDKFKDLEAQGNLEVLEDWINPATQRPAVISAARLRRLQRDFQPIEVTGDPIQYEINRMPKGWVVELINNEGIIKKPDQPAVTDPTAIVHIALRPKVHYSFARIWRGGKTNKHPNLIEIEMAPGSTEYVEFLGD